MERIKCAMMKYSPIRSFLKFGVVAGLVAGFRTLLEYNNIVVEPVHADSP